MTARLIRFFVERHMLVHVIVAVVVVGGVLSTLRAPREAFPNVNLPILVVRATLPGASARDVETKIAIPIQEVISELDGVQQFDTVIKDQSSLTRIELMDDFGIDRIREAQSDLKMLIDGINDFPAEMVDDPIIERINPQQFPVIRVALAGPSAGVAEAAKILDRRLRKLDGVSKVDLVGLPDPEVRILVDPARAREAEVTLLEVVDAIKRRNVSSTGGVLERTTERRQVVLWSRFDQPEDVANTVLRFQSGGGTLRLSDIARVESGREDTGLLVHTNGRPGVSVMVYKREAADIIRTAGAVREAVANTALPADVEAFFDKDESYITRNRVELILKNGLIGAFLVAIVLYIFLTPIAATWTLAGIPVVFLGTLALFSPLGLSINIVSLTALVVVLGMIVDDAVVVSERIVAKRQEGMERHAAAISGAHEMVRPVAASAITTILAFMPLWALGGGPGLVVESMPTVVILALLLSVLESFIILPAHMSLGSHLGMTPKRRFMIRLEERYRKALHVVLEHRGAVITGFCTLFLIVMLGIAPRTETMLFPQDDSEAAFIKITMPPGTPIEQTEAVTTAIENQLRPIMGRDLATITARIGLQDPADEGALQGASENEAVVIARIELRGRENTSAEWIQILERELIVPDQARIVFEPEYLGTPVGAAVTVHVAGNDNGERRSAATEIADGLRALDGLVGVEIDERPGMPQVELSPDFTKLALRGLDAERVGITLQAAFHGIVASEHRSLDDITEYRVMLEPTSRRSLDSLLELPLRASDGNLVLLRDVVNPTEVPAVSRIYHRDGIRTATVSATFAPDSNHTSLSMAQALERDVFPRYANQPGLEITVGGEAVETRKTAGDVPLVSLLVFCGVTLTIAVMLGSFLEAAFVVAIIPFAVAGVMLAIFLHGQALTLFAMIGILGLAGVVVNAAIVMVDAVHRRINALSVDQASDPDARRTAVIDGVVTRLRPIIVTTLTTLGGVLPNAYGIGGHDTMLAPLSLALGWGLAFSTGVTLFLVPALYSYASDLRRKEPNAQSKAQRMLGAAAFITRLFDAKKPTA